MSEIPVIAFTGGGSGGHIYPGLAVIERLRENFKGRIVWIGSRKEADRGVVEAAGIEYFAIPSGKLRRNISLENATDAFKVLAGYWASRNFLSSLKPALLFSKGGYVSVPPCAAAASLRVPVFTHESDLTPGLATRLNAKRAERILVSYEKTLEFLPEHLRKRAVVVGNPVRASISRGDSARGRRFLGAPADSPVVLFVGGSQGARQVNELVLAALPRLIKRAFVAHQTGAWTGTMAATVEARAAGGETGGRTIDGRLVGIANSSERYRPFDYLGDEMPDVLAAADIVVGRAGAGTLWECGALGKPTVLIPLFGSGTRGDQVDNARLFSEAGAAKTLIGAEASPDALFAAICEFLDDPSALKKAGEAARRVAGADAAQAVSNLILEKIGGSR